MIIAQICLLMHILWPFLHTYSMSYRGFLDGSVVKESACQYGRCRSCQFNLWAGKIPWRRAWQPTPIFLHGDPHGQRNLVGYSPLGRKESDMTKHAHTQSMSYKWVISRALDPETCYSHTGRKRNFSLREENDNFSI